MRNPTLASLPLAALLASPAAAESISFDEVPAHNTNRMAVSEEYAHLGVHFVAGDDGAIWNGMSQGDPGGWELEGTNGPAFLGFNGRSYGLTVQFDVPVPAFRIDVSASSGADPGTVFTLEGYRGGAMVESASVVLGGPNEWVTASLAEEVDEVVWYGQTQGFRPYGADNLSWGLEAPAWLDIAIDVMPGNPRNPLNPGKNGVVEVALLGSDALDVADVDPALLRLGVGAGAAAELRSLRTDDVNGDGHDDLVAHYRVPDTGVAYGDTSLCLTGFTHGGVELVGCDAIRTVPR